MSEQKGSPTERLHQKSIQSKEGNLNATDSVDPLKARKPQRSPDEKAKKKRKLLSFEDELQEEPNNITRIKKSAVTKSEKQNGGDNSENLEQRLKEEYAKQSERVREQLIQLEFCYWDGQNVVKKLRRKKRDTVLELLEVCRLDLIQNFQNVAAVEVKDLLFVIKDFIAPHQMSLADIEILKLKTTKNDLLLNLRNVKVKRDGKQMTLSVNLDGPVLIVERSFYEKSKKNYPFCNWQTLNLQEK